RSCVPKRCCARSSATISACRQEACAAITRLTPMATSRLRASSTNAPNGPPPSSMLRAAASMANRIASSSLAKPCGGASSASSQSGRVSANRIASFPPRSETTHQAEVPAAHLRAVAHPLDRAAVGQPRGIAQRAVADLAQAQARRPRLAQAQVHAEAEQRAAAPAGLVVGAARGRGLSLAQTTVGPAALDVEREGVVYVQRRLD